MNFNGTLLLRGVHTFSHGHDTKEILLKERTNSKSYIYSYVH